MQRNGGCQSSQSQQYIEQQRKNHCQERYATKSLLEHIGQSDENQRRTCIRLDTYRECSRENNQSRQDCHKGINHTYAQSCLSQPGIRAEIRSIGRKTTHPQTQREKCLTHGSQKHVCIHLTEIRLQQEFQTLACIGKGHGTYSQYYNQDKQYRHQNLG